MKKAKRKPFIIVPEINILTCIIHCIKLAGRC